jgi:hypothetical protein
MLARDLNLRDIAHALAMKCRYTGHCSQFYSVAQHSVLMSRFDLPGTAVWRLLHDTSEAYLPDVASPIKHNFPDLIAAEELILLRVRERFNLAKYDKGEVKKADIAMCIWEGRRLFVYDPDPIWQRKPDPMPGVPLYPWGPERAEAEFLLEAKRLLEVV